MFLPSLPALKLCGVCLVSMQHIARYLFTSHGSGTLLGGVSRFLSIFFYRGCMYEVIGRAHQEKQMRPPSARSRILGFLALLSCPKSHLGNLISHCSPAGRRCHYHLDELRSVLTTWTYSLPRDVWFTKEYWTATRACE